MVWNETDIYHFLYESLPSSYFMLDASGLIAAVNSFGASRLGYTPSELIAKSVFTMLHDDDREMVQAKLAQLLNSVSTGAHPDSKNALEDACTTWTFRQISKDGSIHWVKAIARAVVHPTNAHPVVLLLCEDITEPEQIEAELRSVSAALDHAGEGISKLDEQGRYVMVNRAYASSVGYEPEDMIGMDWSSTIHPDDLETVVSAYQQMLSQGKAEVEVRGQRKDGSIFYKKVVMVAARDPQQQLIGRFCFIQDITTRKRAEIALRQAQEQLEIKVAERTAELSRANRQLQSEVIERQRVEQALRESEERYRCIVETATEGIWILDQDSKTSFVNSKMAEMLGYTSEEMQGQSLFVFMALEDHAIAEHLLERRQHGIKEQHDFKFRRRDGSALWAIVSANPMLDSAGRYAGVLGMVTDITERKQAELALRESEERYRSVVTAIHEGIVLQDREGNICACNASAEKILGLSADQMVGRNSYDSCWQAIREDGSPFSGDEHPAIVTLRTGKPCSNVVMGVQTVRGSLTWILINSEPLYYPNDKTPYAVVTSFSDITERRQVEETLRKLSSAVEQTADNIIITNRDGLIEYVNPAFEQSTGYTSGEVRNKKPSVLRSGCHGDHFYQQLWSVILSGRVFRDVFINRKNNGELFYEEKTITPLRDSQGNITHFVSTGKDITDQKRTEQKIRESLREKEILLLEIHHRVKNNLQIISSLLSIQSEAIENEQVLEIFKESQNRVQSMALIHEQLYQSKDLIQIDFSEYIQRLAVTLFHSYNTTLEQIALNIDANNVMLSINTAIPCGLILNELISNALKYAFCERKKGFIDIKLSKTEGRCILIVQDNGVGLPEHFDWKNLKSLGFRLVDTLVHQLKGVIQIHQSDGTQFEIVFSELI